MSTKPPYSSQEPNYSSTSFSGSAYAQSNDSRTSFSTVDSRSPLTNARKPEKDWEAAFGQLQTRYGTGGGIPPPEQKRSKTTDGDKPKSSSLSALLPGGGRRKARVKATDSQGLEAVQEEQMAGEPSRSLDARIVHSAGNSSVNLDPSSRPVHHINDSEPVETNVETKRSKFAAVKSFLTRSGGRGGSQRPSAGSRSESTSG